MAQVLQGEARASLIELFPQFQLVNLFFVKSFLDLGLLLHNSTRKHFLIAHCSAVDVEYQCMPLKA